MKFQRAFKLAAFATVLSISIVLFADVWEETSSFAEENNSYSSENFGISPNGDLYIVATGLIGADDSVPSWHVFKQKVGETKLDMVDSYELKTGEQCGPNNVFFVGSNTFVIGRCLEDGDNFAIIRKSSDGGKSWETVEKFQAMKKSDHDVYQSFAVTKKAIFLTTRSATEQGRQGLVRRSLDDGNTFETVDTYQHDGLFTQTYAVVATDDNTLITLSQFLKGDDSGLVIRKSTDGGNTWATASIIEEAGKFFRPFRLLKTSKGKIFITGFLVAEKVNYGMLLSSDNGGASWKTSEMFKPQGYKNSFIYDVKELSNGDLIAAGPISDENGLGHCSIITSKDEGATWKTSLLTAGKSNLGASCFATSEHEDGEVFSIGRTRLTDKLVALVLRKLAQ